MPHRSMSGRLAVAFRLGLSLPLLLLMLKSLHRALEVQQEQGIIRRAWGA